MRAERSARQAASCMCYGCSCATESNLDGTARGVVGAAVPTEAQRASVRVPRVL